MHGVSARGRVADSKIDRSELRNTEENFGSVIGDVARMLWPKRTAAEIAVAAGCSVRNAEFYLAGEQKWSGDAIAAIVAEILSRHKMRNVRVRARP
jgi:hypothetical protein